MTYSSLSSKGSWLSRKPLAVQLFITCSIVTIIIMACLASIITWQSRHNAIEDVYANNADALTSFDRPLQVIFNAAEKNNIALLHVLYRHMGGVPEPLNPDLITQTRDSTPLLVAGGEVINGNSAVMDSVTGFVGNELLVRNGNEWRFVAAGGASPVQPNQVLDTNTQLAQLLEEGETKSYIENVNGAWMASRLIPLKTEAGLLYGALVTRIDISEEVQLILDEIKAYKLANHGTISIVKPTLDGQDWTRVGGAWGTIGDRLSVDNPPADFEVLKSALLQPNGVERVVIDNRHIFLAWSTIDNWDWIVYAFGAEEDFLAQNRKEMWVQIFLMVIGTLAIALLVYWRTARTLAPVQEVVEGMEHLGNGALNFPIADSPQGSQNEVHTLLNSLKQTQQNLQRVIGQVRYGVNEINHNVLDVCSGNTDLSARTEQQAASLQETAASMEEISSTVRQNADHAQQAHKLAQEASTIAHQGGIAVGNVEQTMQGILTSSQRIGEIVNLIDGIAFQTNILALNAAVEAARAGEQGRGFAVVANEVRVLAQRSADAADEIKTLIEHSNTEVSSGSQQVSDAGKTMRQLLQAVDAVTVIMKEIASASEEQWSGIEQVNLAISQIDTVTQQNASLVEQSAESVQTLQHEVRRLADAVQVFQVDTDTSSGHVRPASTLTSRAVPKLSQH